MKRSLFVFLFISILDVYGMCNGYDYRPGNYYIIDPCVEMLDKPSISSCIITKLHTGETITILECMQDVEKPFHDSGYWCKIRTKENITGYITGDHIAYKAVISDLDHNGVNDYVFFKYSGSNHDFYTFDLKTDIVVIINESVIENTGFEAFIDGSKAIWEPEFYYSERFLNEYILIAIPEGYMEEGVIKLFILDGRGMVTQFDERKYSYLDKQIQKIIIEWPSTTKERYFSITTLEKVDNEDEFKESKKVEYFTIYDGPRGVFIGKPSNEP